jgi:hypothetical protein
MKERPIIFRSDNVRAVWEGWKTQTRRVINPGVYLQCIDPEDPEQQQLLLDVCPYGRPGDRLWVRETWVKWDGGLAYLADSLNKQGVEDEDSKRCRLDYGVQWQPSIFMPRWASRITLELTGVRVERLQDISEEDCCRETGAPLRWEGPGLEPYKRDMRGCFRNLWNMINAKRGYSWESNPWVWVIDFKKVQP